MKYFGCAVCVEYKLRCKKAVNNADRKQFRETVTLMKAKPGNKELQKGIHCMEKYSIFYNNSLVP